MSEESRYPDDVDVLVSACSYGDAIISPNGRLLYVVENVSGTVSAYLLNFATNEKTPFVLLNGKNYFLTDNLIFRSRFIHENYIFDTETKIEYPVQNVSELQPSIYKFDGVDTVLLYEYLIKADYVFLVNDLSGMVIVLSSDFRENSQKGFVFNNYDIPKEDLNSTEELLQQYNVSYQKVPSRYVDNTVSPNGKFVAQEDGVYFVDTNQKISEIQGFMLRNRGVARGWVYDSSAVIYSPYYNPCVFDVWGFDGTICVFRVPQPLLILKVPDKYLSP